MTPIVNKANLKTYLINIVLAIFICLLIKSCIYVIKKIDIELKVLVFFTIMSNIIMQVLLFKLYLPFHDANNVLKIGLFVLFITFIENTLYKKNNKGKIISNFIIYSFITNLLMGLIVLIENDFIYFLI